MSTGFELIPWSWPLWTIIRPEGAGHAALAITGPNDTGYWALFTDRQKAQRCIDSGKLAGGLTCPVHDAPECEVRMRSFEKAGIATHATLNPSHGLLRATWSFAEFRELLYRPPKADRPKLLAICNNASCQQAFATKMLLDIDDGEAAHLHGFIYGPCPKCGSDGKVPSGSYSRLAAGTFFNPASFGDAAAIERIFGYVDRISRGEPAEVVVEEGLKTDPDFFEHWRTVLRDPAKVGTLISALMATLTFVRLCWLGSPSPPSPPVDPTSIAVPREVLEVLSELAKDRSSDRTDTPKATGKRAGKKRGRNRG